MPFLRERPALLKAFREGDREAMEKVYWAYIGRVGRFVAVHVRRSDVEDVVQDVFIRAFNAQARLSYDGLRDYGPWLVTIARNIVIDRARRDGREVLKEEISVDEPAEEPAEASSWADPAVMRVVDSYVAALPTPLREVHEYRYVRCLPQREAAAQLGITRQQLRTREDHLRQGLRVALGKASLL
jgi:RNA polymerase sigma-70 factor (ECF subfamily)